MSRTTGSSRAIACAWTGAHGHVIAEAGDHQPVPQRHGRAYADGRPSRVAPAAEPGGVLDARCGVQDDPGDHLAGLLGGDRDGVLRQPVEEVHRAVDGVDDPAHPGAARLAAGLLAEHRVVGTGGEQARADQLLAGAVDLGDDVGRAGLGVGDLDRRRAPLAHHRRRRAGHVEREGEQLGRSARPSGPRRSSRSSRAAQRRHRPARVGAAPDGAHVRRRPEAPDRRPVRSQPALGRRTLDQQVADHRDEPRVDAGRRRPRRPASTAGWRCRSPRCRGPRRPPCGRTRTRRGRSPRRGSPTWPASPGGR